MIEVNIPGEKPLLLKYLVSDVNGTLALDGVLMEGVAAALERLKPSLDIHLLTADTHGRQAEIDRQLGLEAVRIPPGGEAEKKAAYVHRLGAAHTVALGQGANDAAMLKTAALGICVVSAEGTALQALLAAHLLIPDVLSALALLEHPQRIVASLRR